MPRRILHISTRLILGGSQENTVLSCEGQSRLGHEVHLAFGPIYGPEGSLLDRVRAFRTQEGRGITTHVVPHLVRDVNPLADWRAHGELKRLIRELKPDVVHTHSSKAGVLGRLAGWRPGSDRAHPAAARPAVVHTIHGPPFMPVAGSVATRIKVRVNNAIYTVAERIAARRCHAIVSVADAMTREFLRRGIGRAEQYTTVRSGMETGPYLLASPGQDRASVRSALGLSADAFVIGTVARLAEHKGHDDVLEALAADLRADPRWTLLWVGDGWRRERLLARARELGIGVRVAGSPESRENEPRVRAGLVMTGLVAPERIPGLVRAMDVLVHPSAREGLPRTVPQALLCGVMPIASDADGTPEICRDMQTGRLFPVGDRDALRDAVRWADQNPAQRAALAAAGREECRVAFAAETMVAELESVYTRAIKDAHPRR